MRYGIFSDIHSNFEALSAVIRAYQKENINTYLCIGDLVGYGANPIECIEKVKDLASFIVAGNHDWASVDLFSIDFLNPLAAEAILWTKKMLSDSDRAYLASLKLVYKNDDLTLAHGTLDKPQEFSYMVDDYAASESFNWLETNILFVGHTHVPGVFIQDKDGHIIYNRNNVTEVEPEKKYIVNVGSVGQPRDANPKAAYCVYDSDKKTVEIKRVPYDIETTANKIIHSGMPHFLADRLFEGR